MVAGAVLLSGCGFLGSSSPSPSPSAHFPTPAVSPTGSSRDVTFTTTLTSVEKSVAKVGPDDQVLYGWNDLRGGTSFDGSPAQVRLQGSVWYLSGSGPFNGFLTLTFDDGSTLGMWMAGKATASGDQTAFEAQLQVMGGTGKYEQASGSGSWTGSRTGDLGGAVKFDGTVQLSS